MLGRTPLVSMSDKRLGGIENSSLRYFSATRALEISMSRMVKPSFSRKVRRLLPAGSMTRPPLGVLDIIAGRTVLCHESCKNFERSALVTISEQASSRVQPREALMSLAEARA